MLDSHIHIVDTVLSSGFEQVEIQIMFSKSWHPSVLFKAFVTSTLNHLMMDRCGGCKGSAKLSFFQVQNTPGPVALPVSFLEIIFDLNQSKRQVSSMVLP